MRSPLGWHPIGCSCITPRLKSSGAHLHVDNIISCLWSGPHWQHWRAASFFDPRSRCLHRRWWGPTWVTWHSRSCFAALRQIQNVRRDSVTLCLADLGLCTDCQQGGLMQLGSRWPAARPVGVRLECRCPFGFYRATRIHSAAYTVARCPSVCPSVTRRYWV